MIKLLLIASLWCYNGLCLSPEATAVATCESGDTVTLGTMDWQAVNVNVDGTKDTGAFQFNSYWVWSSENRWAIIPVANNVYDISSRDFVRLYPDATKAPPSVQYEMFKNLWDNGYGWQHWSASKPCWDKWMTIKNGKAVFTGD